MNAIWDTHKYGMWTGLLPMERRAYRNRALKDGKGHEDTLFSGIIIIWCLVMSLRLLHGDGIDKFSRPAPKSGAYLSGRFFFLRPWAARWRVFSVYAGLLPQDKKHKSFVIARCAAAVAQYRSYCQRNLPCHVRLNTALFLPVRLIPPYYPPCRRPYVFFGYKKSQPFASIQEWPHTLRFPSMPIAPPEHEPVYRAELVLVKCPARNILIRLSTMPVFPPQLKYGIRPLLLKAHGADRSYPKPARCAGISLYASIHNAAQIKASPSEAPAVQRRRGYPHIFRQKLRISPGASVIAPVYYRLYHKITPLSGLYCPIRGVFILKLFDRVVFVNVKSVF